MKKLLAIVTLITLCIISSSCFGFSTKQDKYDPTYYGETYGPMEVIDGLYACLRTDGYYQILGISEEAVCDGIIIIPQHINGIPVMGLGIPVDENPAPAFGVFPRTHSAVADILYYEGKHQNFNMYKNINGFLLEKNPLGYMAYQGVNKESFFYDAFQNKRIKKMYVSCHHMNIDPFVYLEGLTQYEKPEDALLILNYELINNLRYSQYNDCIQLEESLIQNRYDLKKYYVISQYMYSYYYSQLEEYIKNYEPQGYFASEEKKQLAIEGEKERLQYRGKISNVEFHYNLIIDGVEYHDENNFSTDLYWIDYLNDGDLLMEPPAPYVEGYDFLGWYQNVECTMPYSFNMPVQKVEDELVWLTLYAKWQKQ